MFRSLLWPSSGCRTVGIQVICYWLHKTHEKNLAKFLSTDFSEHPIVKYHSIVKKTFLSLFLTRQYFVYCVEMKKQYSPVLLTVIWQVPLVAVRTLPVLRFDALDVKKNTKLWNVRRAPRRQGTVPKTFSYRWCQLREIVTCITAAGHCYVVAEVRL